MRLVMAVMVLLMAPAAAQAASGQDFEGSWRPPASTGSNYRVTNDPETEAGFVGRVTENSASVAICKGGPDASDAFWTAKQEGALNGGATFIGRTFVFTKDVEGNCSARSVRAKFWPLVDDRLRICPNAFDNPEGAPTLDTTSPVDESPTCTDFLRADDPIQVQQHVAGDYLGKIFRDDNSCATDYNITLRYVEDDPMNDVKVFLKRAGGGFKFANNNRLFLPLKTDAGRKRILEFRWVKKGPLTVKVRVRTQSGETYTRKRAFSACRP